MAEKTELRGMIDRRIVDVIDAECAARGGVARIEIVEEWLKAAADRKVHAAILLYRVTRDDPRWAEGERRADP